MCACVCFFFFLPFLSRGSLDSSASGSHDGLIRGLQPSELLLAFSLVPPDGEPRRPRPAAKFTHTHIHSHAFTFNPSRDTTPLSECVSTNPEWCKNKIIIIIIIITLQAKHLSPLHLLRTANSSCIHHTSLFHAGNNGAEMFLPTLCQLLN